jgi:spermidine/putrescine transport system permease protein
MTTPKIRAASSAKRWTQWSVSLPPLSFMAFFFGLPSLIMIAASFMIPGDTGGLAALFPLLKPIINPQDGLQESGVTLENYRVFFSDTVYAWIFLKSLFVAGLTTFLCLLMGYPLALLISRTPKHRRDLLILLVVLPFASNFLVRVYAWMIILGPMGLLFTHTAVILGLVYVHLPFMILPLYTNLEKHDSALLEAAQNLGASRWQAFWSVTFPLSLPGIFSGGALVFIPVLGMFAIPEILGGKDSMLIGNLIKEAFLATRDWPFGSMISMMLTLAVLGIASLSSRLGSRYAPSGKNV